MGNCKKKLRSRSGFPRRAGVALIFAACLPLMCGCIHFFYNAGVKKFAFPSSGVPATRPVAAQAASAPVVLSQDQWLNLPAEPSTFDPEKLEQEILALTNDLRVANGLTPLKAAVSLAQVARGHSQEMASLNYFSHESPLPANQTAEDRLNNAGLGYTVSAENIAQEPIIRGFWSDGRVDRYTWGEVARNTIRHWFSSIGHRRNLLRRDVEEIGIGASLQFQGRLQYVLITQTFRAP